MKKKDLYGIIKNIVKEQSARFRGKGKEMVDPQTGELLNPLNPKQKDKKELPPLDPIANVDINPPNPPPTPQSLDHEDCVEDGDGFGNNYGMITMMNDDCDGTNEQIDISKIMCCGHNNNNPDKDVFAGSLTINSLTGVNGSSYAIMAFSDWECFCPNPEVDNVDGDFFENLNTGNNPLNQSYVSEGLICCNCTVERPWIADPASLADAYVVLDTLTYSDFETWALYVNSNYNIVLAMNNGQKCAGCSDPLADNYGWDDYGNQNNTDIYGCAVGSVDGVTSQNYTGIENQDATDNGCCVYSGCMQYGATLGGSLAYLVPLFSTANSTSPTTNMAGGTGTTRGADGLWKEDGTCTWTGCTHTSANTTNTGTISGQDTTQYSAGLFANGQTVPHYIEDGSCNGEYGCTEQFGTPDYASSTVQAYGGGNDYPPNPPAVELCAGCPDPAMANTYAGDDVDLSGNPEYDCAGDPVLTPGSAPFGDVSCCTAFVGGCMDNGTGTNGPNSLADYEASTYPQNGQAARPATWNPDGSGGTFPACNFDTNATQESGTCEYVDCVGCIESEFDATGFTSGLSYNATSTIATGTYTYSTGCEFDGCLDEEITLPGQPPIVTDNWVCDINPDLCDNGSSAGSQPDTNLGTFVDTTSMCEYELLGCTDPNSCNYNQNATVLDPNNPCTPPGSCQICTDVGANNGAYGPNLEWDGSYSNDPACDCVRVEAHRCHYDHIIQDFGCMTIGGNDPDTSSNNMFKHIPKHKEDHLSMPMEEGINEKIERAPGQCWVVDSITPHSSPSIPNYNACDCQPMNWKCFCPSTGLYGGNNGQPSTNHVHKCVLTTVPLGTNSAVFATWSECHDTYACYYVPHGKTGAGYEGNCHLNAAGQQECPKDDWAPDPIGIDPVGDKGVVVPGVDLDTGLPPSSGDQDNPNLPSTPEITESRKLRESFKNHFMLTEDQKLKKLIKKSIKRKK